MARFFKKMHKKAGLPPGVLVHIGKERTEKITVAEIDFNEVNLLEKTISDLDPFFPVCDKEKFLVKWINICGVHQVDFIEKIGKHFNIHPLTLEDIVNTGQRSKVENYGHYLYIVSRMLYFDETKKEVFSEQISIILEDGVLISFQEVEGDVFDGVRDRIRKGRGKIRQSGCDYLAYAILDAIVDHYFVVLGVIGDNMEALEEELLENPTQETSRMIHEMKREMIYLRKQVWPLREVLGNLSKADSPLIKESTVIYLRDVYDHTIQVMDTIESYRDILSGMMDNYLSVVSNKMNEVMKLLTIIATIFIPITFIVGVYGMNFQYMPELEWKWGYFMVMALMCCVVVFMLIYFKRKKWI
ncbi:MAG: magnesium/cobalt transporter CorA [Desulfobacterales bacterium]